MHPKQIAFYGKGGVGTSTVTSNISAALSEMGFRVIQIGCDPKKDSTATLRGGKLVLSLLASAHAEQPVKLTDIAAEGYLGVICIEMGETVTPDRCAGEGMAEAFARLRQLCVFEEYLPDFVLYDVPGDTLCSGFASPVINGVAEQVFVVTSADFSALHAANNVFTAIVEYGSTGGAKLGGIIVNGLSASFGESIVADFAHRARAGIVGWSPRSLVVSQCELYGKTVIEAAPLSIHSYIYRKLARYMAGDNKTSIPQPLTGTELRQWGQEWGDRILELETGVLQNGGGI